MWEPMEAGGKWFTLWDNDGTSMILFFVCETNARRFCGAVQRLIATGRTVYELGVKRALLKGTDPGTILGLMDKLIAELPDEPIMVNEEKGEVPT